MENAIAKKEGTQIAQREAPGRGTESGFQREDLIIPRVNLLQALSPAVSEAGSLLRPGQIVNSLTKEILPEVFIPVFLFVNWIRFNPRDSKKDGFDPAFEPGAMMWKSTDPNDPRVKEQGVFGPNGEPPIATKFLNFFSYFPGSSTPVILSFSKTSFRAGRELLTLTQLGGGDMFSKKYSLTSKQDTNGQFTYFVFQEKGAGRSNDEERAEAEAFWQQFHEKDIVVHEEGKEESTDAEAVPF
jgi:hypothetical protein